MSRCSKKSNEIKEKIDSISGLDGEYVYERLDKIEKIIKEINKHCDENDVNGTIFENKSADEMFEKLGYELKDEKICPHSYVYIKKYDFSIKEIVLEKAKYLITICYYKIGTDGRITTINSIEYHLSMQELQAINKKCKELGWIE